MHELSDLVKQAEKDKIQETLDILLKALDLISSTNRSLTDQLIAMNQRVRRLEEMHG